MALTLSQLRRFAVARSLFAPTALDRAVAALGFVQADPIRAPARAQDLTLRHRVTGYIAGDLERHYGSLDIEEDTFINYGFVTRHVYELMHPRSRTPPWTRTQRTRAREVLDFVRERGVVHPRDLDEAFVDGAVVNYWGGQSKASTHLLDYMHYRGLVRIAGRRDGIRTYAVRDAIAPVTDASEKQQRIDRLVDVVVGKYAPLPAAGLALVVRRLRYAAPQWHGVLTSALARARSRLARATVDGTDWYWPAGESPGVEEVPRMVRLLTPFDPVVWDRGRFARLWEWEYRFEAYTPPAQRVRGYYALPLLWGEQVIGWANVTAKEGRLQTAFGYVAGTAPRERGFRTALEEEVERLRVFLALPDAGDARRRR